MGTARSTWALRHLLAVLAVVVAADAGAGTTRAARSGALFPEDSRLAGKVTVDPAPLYLDELIERLSGDAKVRLSVDDASGPVSGILLVASLRGVALREVMAGLVDLLSHRFQTWAWRPVGEKGGGYVLRHSPSMASASAAAREAITRRWDEDLRKYHEIARMPADQRAGSAASRPDLFGAGILESGMPDLVGTLELADLEKLLRGGSVAVRPEGLSDKAREALSLGIRGGTVTTPTPPVSPGFYVTWDPSNIGPVLWCRNESGAALNVVGGIRWDRSWQEGMNDGWRGPWDPEVQEFRKKRDRKDPSVGEPDRKGTMAEWVKRAAARQELNVLADLVDPQQFSRYSQVTWIGRTPVLTVLSMVSATVVTRRRGDLHLLRHTSNAVHPRAHLVSWPRIRDLRRAATRNEGYFDLKTLAECADLNGEQLRGLYPEFRDLDPQRFEDWRPILLFRRHLHAAAQEHVKTPGGLAFRDAGLAAKRVLLESAPDPRNVRALSLLLRDADRATVRLTEETTREPAKGEPPREVRRLVWEVEVAGTPVIRSVFRQEARQPPEGQR